MDGDHVALDEYPLDLNPEFGEFMLHKIEELAKSLPPVRHIGVVLDVVVCEMSEGRGIVTAIHPCLVELQDHITVGPLLIGVLLIRTDTSRSGHIDSPERPSVRTSCWRSWHSTAHPAAHPNAPRPCHSRC